MGQSSKDDSATAGDDSSAGDLPDSNSGLFSEGEKVLAYHDFFSIQEVMVGRFVILVCVLTVEKTGEKKSKL
ncbi:unnamed protein product [Ilex paraguariensis]|uniref:Uncharacterized protein n=1 Tax=Ilex paraguariensis TaxID=185542 RepID=A0ABC8TCF0_9AQUA